MSDVNVGDSSVYDAVDDSCGDGDIGYRRWYWWWWYAVLQWFDWVSRMPSSTAFVSTWMKSIEVSRSSSVSCVECPRHVSCWSTSMERSYGYVTYCWLTWATYNQQLTVITCTVVLVVVFWLNCVLLNVWKLFICLDAFVVYRTKGIRYTLLHSEAIYPHQLRLDVGIPCSHLANGTDGRILALLNAVYHKAVGRSE